MILALFTGVTSGAENSQVTDARLAELEKKLGEIQSSYEGRIAAMEKEIAALKAILAAKGAGQGQPGTASAPAISPGGGPAGTAQELAGAHPAAVAAAGTSGAKTPEQIELEKQLAKELGGQDKTAAPPAATVAEGQTAAPPGAAGQTAPPPAQPWSPAQPITLAGGGKNYLNLSLDGLFAVGTSTAQFVPLVEGGGHDPNQRGFNIQNVEMVLEGAVDPYFRGQANVILQLAPDGSTNVELEEAYVVTTSLPYNLQVKGGAFLTEFGRINTQHPHTWDFVDQPLVESRILGTDGLRGPGARVSWLMPTSFYSELFLTVQDSQGETAESFRWVPGELYAGHPILARPVRTLGDMLYVPRWTGSFDLTSNQTLVAGASAAFGPNGTSQSASTQIYGIDLFWKWKSPTAQAGFPFVKWQTEGMLRHYQAGPWPPDGGIPASDPLPPLPPGYTLPAETLKDWGGYTQILWGFKRNWVAGLRYDYVAGATGAIGPDPLLEWRWRITPDITWYPTEFSKLRLQWNHDQLELSGTQESIWLQFEFLLGAHAAHKF